VEKSTKTVERLAAKYGGIVADENIINATDQVGNAITIRVPVVSFEQLLDELDDEALFINYKKISSQNVTEEYQDIQTRLKTKKEVRDRYLDILRTKAKTVEDILKAEEHIRALQEEIESREGRLRFLQTRTSMSEITVEIYQKVILTESPTMVEKPFLTKAQEAMSTGWSFITASLLFFISCWPLWLICFLISIAWRRYWRRLKAQEAI
jgi:hypothetical protein